MSLTAAAAAAGHDDDDDDLKDSANDLNELLHENEINKHHENIPAASNIKRLTAYQRYFLTAFSERITVNPLKDCRVLIGQHLKVEETCINSWFLKRRRIMLSTITPLEERRKSNKKARDNFRTIAAQIDADFHQKPRNNIEVENPVQEWMEEDRRLLFDILAYYARLGKADHFGIFGRREQQRCTADCTDRDPWLDILRWFKHLGGSIKLQQIDSMKRQMGYWRLRNLKYSSKLRCNYRAAGYGQENIKRQIEERVGETEFGKMTLGLLSNGLEATYENLRALYRLADKSSANDNHAFASKEHRTAAVTSNQEDDLLESDGDESEDIPLDDLECDDEEFESIDDNSRDKELIDDNSRDKELIDEKSETESIDWLQGYLLDDDDGDDHHAGDNAGTPVVKSCSVPLSASLVTTKNTAVVQTTTTTTTNASAAMFPTPKTPESARNTGNNSLLHLPNFIQRRLFASPAAAVPPARQDNTVNECQSEIDEPPSSLGFLPDMQLSPGGGKRQRPNSSSLPSIFPNIQQLEGEDDSTQAGDHGDLKSISRLQTCVRFVEHLAFAKPTEFCRALAVVERNQNIFFCLSNTGRIRFLQNSGFEVLDQNQ